MYITDRAGNRLPDYDGDELTVSDTEEAQEWIAYFFTYYAGDRYNLCNDDGTLNTAYYRDWAATE